ncbi:unnamed protein product [Blepharisma stoltei]|uniref:RING-CH-type domain-containing protein n=1 Tax=Blepharisma stoltei TaxID=1481888 RepID=A0AAU9JW81_9CILI|nr:unnamed protein product [Blepharisma stoltei]
MDIRLFATFTTESHAKVEKKHQKRRSSTGECFLNVTSKIQMKKRFSLDFTCLNYFTKNIDTISSNSSPRSQISCRICLDSSRRDELIAPCKCKGSLKFVHKSCLKQWLDACPKQDDEAHFCELCKCKLDIKFRYIWSYRKNCSKNSSLVISMIISFLVIFSLLALIGAKVSSGEMDSMLTTLFVLLALAMMFCFGVTTLSLKSQCLRLSVIDWESA